MPGKPRVNVNTCSTVGVLVFTTNQSVNSGVPLHDNFDKVFNKCGDQIQQLSLI
ncbi:hypothetical protein AHF37_12053 [Paragonimus kellicotti]|nr:hypothetical protein AHF37_12053 [Paragonimus kellicotti]